MVLRNKKFLQRLFISIVIMLQLKRKDNALLECGFGFQFIEVNTAVL